MHHHLAIAAFSRFRLAMCTSHPQESTGRLGKPEGWISVRTIALEMAGTGVKMPMAGTLADALAAGNAVATRWHTGILPHGEPAQCLLVL